MRKNLIYVAVAFCLAISIYKIYRVFNYSKAPAKVGECLEIADPTLGRVEFKVARNNDSKEYSDGTVFAELVPGVNFKSYVRVTYKELKDLKAKKTECLQ